MVMLFLFSVAMYCLVRAIEGTAEQKRVGFWLSGLGVLFGLLALTHALTIWLLPGCLFRHLLLQAPVSPAILVLGFFLVVYAPWMLRNQMVTGTMTGVSVYAALDGVKLSERGWMRQSDPDFGRQHPGATAEVAGELQHTGSTGSISFSAPGLPCPHYHLPAAPLSEASSAFMLR